MNQALYDEFLSLNAAGERAQAKLALKDFVASFGSGEERVRWLFPFLRDWEAQTEPGVAIRFELYRDLAFPILYEGYQQDDEACVVWLAKTAGNLVADKNLWRKIDYKPAAVLLEEAYRLHPREQTRQLLLRELLNCCQGAAAALESARSAPTGGDTIHRQDLLHWLELATELDEERVYASRLVDLERRCRRATDIDSATDDPEICPQP